MNDQSNKVKAYQKQWWRKNPERLAERNFRAKKRWRDWFENEVKANLACERCGENHPGVLDFHHKEPSEKTSTVSEMVQRSCSKKKILAEIAKCEVLCANCHRKHHWEATRQIWLEREKKYDDYARTLESEWTCRYCGRSKAEVQEWKSKFRCKECYNANQAATMRMRR